MKYMEVPLSTLTPTTTSTRSGRRVVVASIGAKIWTASTGFITTPADVRQWRACACAVIRGRCCDRHSCKRRRCRKNDVWGTSPIIRSIKSYLQSDLGKIEAKWSVAVLVHIGYLENMVEMVLNFVGVKGHSAHGSLRQVLCKTLAYPVTVAIIVQYLLAGEAVAHSFS